MGSLPPSVRQLYARSATCNQQERPHRKHDLHRGTPMAARMDRYPAPATQEHPQLPLGVNPADRGLALLPLARTGRMAFRWWQDRPHA
jgi:hypothetical protein